MENCYVCGRKLSDDGAVGTAKRHKEHIIHNGIYGKLKSSTILCRECGGAYSKDDAKFVEIFSGFIGLLRDKLISKDHGSTDSKRLKGFLYLPDGETNDVEYCKGKVYPSNPYYEINEDAKVIKIYGQKNRIKHYHNVILKQHPEYTDFTIERYDNISTVGTIGLFFSEGNADFNKIFREGMCKIATEFALHCDVKKEDLPNTLKLGENDSSLLITDKNPIVPYMPHSSIDMIMALMDDYIDEKYPIHLLRLYSETQKKGRSLVCYIELFSTFKYYVLLNPNYEGPDIDRWYCQTIISELDNVGNPQVPELNVSKVLDDKRNTLYQILSTYLNSKFLPELLFERRTIGMLIDQTICNEGLEQLIREMLDQLSPDNYMKTTIYHYNDADSSYVSTFEQCLDASIDHVRDFTFFKFNQLDRFCWNYVKILEARKR